MIDERKIELMTQLVDEYISSAHPVGSLMLVERYRLAWSTATIRNEMALLEEAGYMFQPYTSAGRVPTKQGYRLYIQHLRPARLSQRAVSHLEQTIQSLADTSPSSLKDISRALADISGEIAFVAIGAYAVTSGIQNLSGKPEFDDPDFMEEIVGILDTLEERLESINEELSCEPRMFIGDAKHFGKTCSVLAVATTLKGKPVMVGLIGPLRMNYGKNMALLQSLTISH
ncbi:hypothetical protein HY732_00245 [Candidatus Uhrbacteria bacterium]|nr:hypothetical protein [Candidatus Uhrbacteria bacterium]